MADHNFLPTVATTMNCIRDSLQDSSFDTNPSQAALKNHTRALRTVRKSILANETATEGLILSVLFLVVLEVRRAVPL